LAAQQVAVPREPPPEQNGDPAYRAFDMQHLKDVPYSGSLPKPIFPSSDRVQRSFIVEYVYDYAYSTYRPEVQLPVVSPLQAKRDNPEDALIAFFSAMRTGDYEAFLKCWDDATQATLRAQAKDKNQGAAYWQNIWKQMFGNKQVLLADRMETNGYVILDTRFSTPAGSAAFPNIFKLVGQQWLATNDLSADPLIMNIPPRLAGEIIRVQPTASAKLSNPADKQQLQSQADFLRYHDTRDNINHAGH
jgi:hypothetical protein